MGTIEARIKELGIELPARPPLAVANYLPGVAVGEVLYVSGTIGTAIGADGKDYLPIQGKLGDISIDQGYQSARYMGLNHLAMMKHVLGDLDRVVRIMRIVGYVNAAPGFKDAPKVLNGESDLMVEVFGEESGRHARAALYQNELTFDAPVESEMIVQIRP